MNQRRKPHYENGTLKKILFDGGYVDMIGDAPVYMFFIKDHLGSVRAVVSETGEVLQTNEFYSYGDLFSSAGTADTSGNRYRFTGKELGNETGLYDFSARFLQPRFGRFTTLDPLAEKYPSVSPYAYCKCNPVRYIDPDGRMPWILPILPLLGETLVATSIIAVTGYVLYKESRKDSASRDLSGWKEQQRRDRKNKQQLDQAQANIQNSIENNYPDPDHYDPNDNPNFRDGSKFSKSLLLGLYLTGSNHDFIKTIIDNRDKKPDFDNENKSTDVATYNTYVKDAIVDAEKEDVNNSNY